MGETMSRRRTRPNAPIRIAYLNGSLEIGGSERQMVELALRLPRDRFAPEFVLLTGRGPLADQAEAGGVPVHVLNWARAGESWRRVRRTRDVARYVSTMRRGQFDIVDAWLFHAYVLAAATRPMTGVRAVIAGRRCLFDFKAGDHPINRLLDEIARRRVDAIVANSDGVLRDTVAHEGIAPERICVIRNGARIPATLLPEVRDSIRGRWGAGPDRVVIGCIANYKPKKGLDAVVAVASIVTAAVPESMFVLIGEGPLRPSLQRQIDEAGLTNRVLLNGMEPDGAQVVGGFDIALQASLSEGLPNALLEAATAGVPVVATNVGGTAEVVADGSTGRLVEPGDNAVMAEALIWLATSRDRRMRFGDAGRALVAERFGMDRFVAETIDLYEQVLARRAPR
jgi:glycosyltransferase involved in cell wall biosynthesis